MARLAAGKRDTKPGPPDAKPGSPAYSVPPPGSFEGIGPQTMAETVRPLPLSDMPPKAKAIFVNNERLPIENVQELRKQGALGFVKPALYLPKGRTLIAFSEGGPSRACERDGHFAQAYSALRQRLMKGSRLDMGKLVACMRDCFGAFDTPYVLHLMGRYYHEEGRLEAACRKYKRALSVNPCFAPAHLQLACVYHQHLRDAAAARRELLLAHHFNIGDVFAMQAELWELAASLSLDSFDEDVRLSAADYVPAPSQPRPEDADIHALRCAAQKYIASPLIEAKIENNMAVYFAADGRPDLAVGHYLAALRQLKAVPDGPERNQIVKSIYGSLRGAYHKMGWAETEEYEAILAAR